MLSSGPYLTSEGLCFSTRENSLALQGAGEGNIYIYFSQLERVILFSMLDRNLK